MAMVFPCPAIEALRAQLEPLIHLLRDTLRLPPDLEAALVSGATAPPMNLLRLAYTLPASESHHDAEPLGLVSHSIRVATKATALFRERVPEPDPSATERHEHWLRMLIALYLSALMHDVGKLWFMDVKIGTRNWPVNRYLADFAREQQASEMLVTHRPGRTRAGATGHEPISLVYLTMVVPLASLPRLGSQAMNDLLATLMATLGAQPSNDAYLLVKEADTACTGEAIAKVRKPTAATKPYAAGSGTIADDLVQGFRLVNEDRRLRYNLPEGHLLVSPSHTVLFITMNGGNTVFRLIYEAMRAEVHRAGVGSYIKSFYDAGDPHRYLDEVANRMALNGLPWCVPAVPSDSPDSKTIRHFCVVTDAGRKRRTGYAIVMRNDALWGSVDFSGKGIFSGQVAFFTEDKKTPSADAEDLGFQAHDTAVTTVRPRQVKLTAAADSERADSVLDLGTVASLLVREIGALVPDVASPEHQRRWLDLGNAITDRVPDPIVLPSLEACLDRLRHFRAALSQGSTVHSIAIPSAAATTSPAESTPTPDHGGGDLTARVVAAIGSLVTAIRRHGAGALAPHAAFHALALPEGWVFLPWPQCLDGLVPATDQVHAGAPETLNEILTLGNLPRPAPARVVGYAYGGGRKHHKGLLIPPSWIPSVAAPVDLSLVQLASGLLDGHGAVGAR